MSVERRLLGYSGMRVDWPHIRAIESATAHDFDMLCRGMFTGLGRPYVSSGFDVQIPTAAINASQLIITVANSTIVHSSASESGTILTLPTTQADEVLTPSNPRVIGSFQANSLNYVALDYRRKTDTSTVDNTAGWSPSQLLEFQRTVPIGQILDYRFIISTAGFSTYLPLYIVQTTNTGAVQWITKAVNDFWRLGTGGANPNPFNSFNWGNLVNPQPGANPRREWIGSVAGANPLTVQPGDPVTAFGFGDFSIHNLKDFVDAVWTRFKEVTGSQYGYFDSALPGPGGTGSGPGLNLHDVAFDSIGSVLTGAGELSYNLVLASTAPTDGAFQSPLSDNTAQPGDTYAEGVLSATKATITSFISNNLIVNSLTSNVGFINNPTPEALRTRRLYRPNLGLWALTAYSDLEPIPNRQATLHRTQGGVGTLTNNISSWSFQNITSPTAEASWTLITINTSTAHGMLPGTFVRVQGLLASISISPDGVHRVLDAPSTTQLIIAVNVPMSGTPTVAGVNGVVLDNQTRSPYNPSLAITAFAPATGTQAYVTVPGNNFNAPQSLIGNISSGSNIITNISTPNKLYIGMIVSTSYLNTGSAYITRIVSGTSVEVSQPGNANVVDATLTVTQEILVQGLRATGFTSQQLDGKYPIIGLGPTQQLVIDLGVTVVTTSLAVGASCDQVYYKLLLSVTGALPIQYNVTNANAFSIANDKVSYICGLDTLPAMVQATGAIQFDGVISNSIVAQPVLVDTIVNDGAGNLTVTCASPPGLVTGGPQNFTIYGDSTLSDYIRSYTGINILVIGGTPTFALDVDGIAGSTVPPSSGAPTGSLTTTDWQGNDFTLPGTINLGKIAVVGASPTGTPTGNVLIDVYNLPASGPAWSNVTTYATGALVSFGIYNYISLQNANTNQNPATQIAYWAQQTPQPITPWSNVRTYAAGNTVSYLGNIYTSIQSSNLNQNPATQVAFWTVQPSIVTGVIATSDPVLANTLANNVTTFFAFSGAGYPSLPAGNYCFLARGTTADGSNAARLKSTGTPPANHGDAVASTDGGTTFSSVDYSNYYQIYLEMPASSNVFEIQGTGIILDHSHDYTNSGHDKTFINLSDNPYPGPVQWSSDIVVKSIVGDLSFTIPQTAVVDTSDTNVDPHANDYNVNGQTGTAYLQDGEVLFIKLERNKPVTNNTIYSTAGGSSTIATSSIMTDIHSNPLVPGDYIKFANEADSYWLRIRTINATSVTLITDRGQDPTGGTAGQRPPNSGPMLYTKGAYPLTYVKKHWAVDPSPDTYWIAMRRDNGGTGILGSKVYFRALELSAGEVRPVNDGISNNLLIYTGAFNEGATNPNYSVSDPSGLFQHSVALTVDSVDNLTQMITFSSGPGNIPQAGDTIQYFDGTNYHYYTITQPISSRTVIVQQATSALSSLSPVTYFRQNQFIEDVDNLTLALRKEDRQAGQVSTALTRPVYDESMFIQQMNLGGSGTVRSGSYVYQGPIGNPTALAWVMHGNVPVSETIEDATIVMPGGHSTIGANAILVNVVFGTFLNGTGLFQNGSSTGRTVNNPGDPPFNSPSVYGDNSGGGVELVLPPNERTEQTSSAGIVVYGTHAFYKQSSNVLHTGEELLVIVNDGIREAFYDYTETFGGPKAKIQLVRALPVNTRIRFRILAAYGSAVAAAAANITLQAAYNAGSSIQTAPGVPVLIQSDNVNAGNAGIDLRGSLYIYGGTSQLGGIFNETGQDQTFVIGNEINKPKNVWAGTDIVKTHTAHPGSGNIRSTADQVVTGASGTIITGSTLTLQDNYSYRIKINATARRSDGTFGVASFTMEGTFHCESGTAAAAGSPISVDNGADGDGVNYAIVFAVSGNQVMAVVYGTSGATVQWVLTMEQQGVGLP